MKPLDRRVFVLLLFALAFLSRFGVVLAFRDIHQGPTGESSADDVQFDLLARHVAQGIGYRFTAAGPPTAFRAPGLPFFLAGVYTLVGIEPAAAYVSFCLLGAIACVLTYLLAREVMSEAGSQSAALLAALYFPHVYMATSFMSETLFIPCLALGLWLFVRFLKYQRIGTLIGAALALGLAALTRPNALLLLPCLVVVLLCSKFRSLGYGLCASAGFSVVFLLVIAPWTVRNYQVFGKPVLIATNGGSTFWGSNNDLVLNEWRHLGYWVSTTELPGRDLVDAAPNEVAHDEVEWQLGKQWVLSHLTSMPRLELYKLARLFWLPDFGPAKRWLRVAGYVPFLLLLLLAVWRCLWRKSAWTSPWQVLHASTLVVLATALIFQGEPRYRDANLPVLMIYAALGLNPRWLSPHASAGQETASPMPLAAQARDAPAYFRCSASISR